MINGYVDESESDGVFVMAGFVAPAEEWAKFSDAWDAALAAPPKATGLFKAREVMRKRPSGAFWGMRDEQRNEKLETLYSVIDAHASYCVYSIVHLEPLHRLCAAYGFRKQAADPYYHALSEIIIGVAKIQVTQGTPLDEKVDWVFDEHKNESRVNEIWGAVIHDAPDPAVKRMLAGTPIFRKDDNVRPLQAADLEAWWMRRRGLEQLKGLPRLEYPWTPTDMPIAGGTLNETALIKKFDEMARIADELAILDPNGEFF
jgi:hypothetical protein